MAQVGRDDCSAHARAHQDHVLGTVRQLVSRLPFLPNKDIVFAGIATFLIGSDTWINERWSSYPAIMAGYRAWLSQLPREVAEKIAFRNAERLFGQQ